MENNKSVRLDTHSSAKLILSAFVPAYLRGLDVKTYVYDKFINRMKNDHSSEYQERKEILYNCLHLFTNSKTKSQIDALKEQMKNFSYNNFAGEILSNFSDKIIGYNKDCFAAIVVLPSFVHAYMQGSDIKPVYERLLSEIPNDNNSENVEKRKILENCLTLFKNTNCQEQISTLKQTLTGTGREISDNEFSENILLNFPEMILSTNKRDFSQIVLESFVDSYIQKSDLRALYDKLRARIPNDNTLQNTERRKVLENCLDFFNNVKNRNILNQQINTNDLKQQSKEELAETLLQRFSENILGDHKRKYDMSHKYCEDMLDLRTFDYIQSPVEYDGPPLKYDNSDIEIKISRLGRLSYKTNTLADDSIDRYSILVLEKNIPIQEYKVFSDINLEKLATDIHYRQAVLGELLSKNNIELSNTNGFIGVIDEADTDYKPQLKIGEELDDGYSTYRYRCPSSEKHHLVYQTEPVTAVMMWTQYQELKKKHEKIKDDDGR